MYKRNEALKSQLTLPSQKVKVIWCVQSHVLLFEVSGGEPFRVFRSGYYWQYWCPPPPPPPLPVLQLPMEKSTPKKRQRRSTTWVMPNPSLLLQVSSQPAEVISGATCRTCYSVYSSQHEEDKQKSLAPLPMRRSASDAGVSEEIAKILAEKRKAWGCMALYFGCRCRSLDHIYKEEMKKAQVSGALSEVHVALSRQPGQPKVGTPCPSSEEAVTVVLSSP